MVNTAVELSNSDTEIAEIINQNQKAFEEALVKAISKGQEEGVLSKKQQAKDLARFFYHNIVGLRVTLKHSQLDHSIEDVINLTLSILKK